MECKLYKIEYNLMWGYMGGEDSKVVIMNKLLKCFPEWKIVKLSDWEYNLDDKYGNVIFSNNNDTICAYSEISMRSEVKFSTDTIIKYLDSIISIITEYNWWQKYTSDKLNIRDIKIKYKWTTDKYNLPTFINGLWNTNTYAFENNITKHNILDELDCDIDTNITSNTFTSDKAEVGLVKQTFTITRGKWEYFPTSILKTFLDKSESITICK